MPSQVPRCKVARARSVKAVGFVVEEKVNEASGAVVGVANAESELEPVVDAATMTAVKLAGTRLGNKRGDEGNGNDDDKATRAAAREDENIKLFLP